MGTKPYVDHARSIMRIVLLLGMAVIVCAFGVSASEDGAFPRTVVDGLGIEIKLDNRPERIFSTGLAMDNILLEMTDANRVVGVTRFALDPDESYVADRVEPHMTIIDQLHPELVIAAQPDIVIVANWSNPDAVKQLKDLDVPVYTLTTFDTLDDALENIRRIGEVTGDDEKAKQLIASFHTAYASIEKRLEGVSRPGVLYYDSWGSTTGANTAVGDIITMAGGVNVAAEFGLVGWNDIDREAIVAMNPDVIITGSGYDFADAILSDVALATVPAVYNERVYFVEHTGALNHHFIHAIDALARKLHPEAFER